MVNRYGAIIYASDALFGRVAQEAMSALAAERGTGSLAHLHAGAVAFSRAGDPSIGEFQGAMILAQFGDVDLNALSE
jgi:hypothetical protein